jgi:hypothetical protein
MFPESFLAALLEAGVVGVVEQESADVEGDGEPFLFLRGEVGLFTVVTLAFGAGGTHVEEGDEQAARLGLEGTVSGAAG